MILKTAAKIGVKTIGDAFLVRFKSAVGAVRAGMDIQNEFLEIQQR